MLGWFRRKNKPAHNPDQSEEREVQESAPQDSAGDHQEKAADLIEQQPTEIADSDEEVGEKEEATAVEEEEATAVEEEPEQPEEDPPPVADKAPPSMFRRLSEKLSRTRESFTHRLDELFLGKKEIDADLFDDLEEILVTADLGIGTTQELLELARKRVKRDALSDPQALKEILKDHIKKLITEHEKPSELVMPSDGPFIIMVVGVNGVGKTTTIGKITKKFLSSGQTVLLVAADTFRAAASSQLKIWGERNDVRVVAQHEGADPSSVVFDAMAVAKSKNYDVVLVDTAGRLHTKANLMEELKKIKRVMGKQLEGAPHEVLLVIDATTGQNGISQATLFNEAVEVTGIALTKLDGTAKGGIVANISRELKTPIRFIGVGEKVDDLRDFNADEFVEALFDSSAGNI